MSTSYLGSIIKHLTEIVETLEEGGTVISPRRLGQVVQTQLCVQADTTRIKHGIRHLQRLDEVEGIHEKVSVNEDDINEIVGRFLSWRLPEVSGQRASGNQPVQRHTDGTNGKAYLRERVKPRTGKRPWSPPRRTRDVRSPSRWATGGPHSPPDW